jgi:hypothetical protein
MGMNRKRTEGAACAFLNSYFRICSIEKLTIYSDPWADVRCVVSGQAWALKCGVLWSRGRGSEVLVLRPELWAVVDDAIKGHRSRGIPLWGGGTLPEKSRLHSSRIRVFDLGEDVGEG